MQDEATIVDNKEALDQTSVDIKSLLDAVNSSKFDESETLLLGKDSFEKAESFFDLIKSDTESDNNFISESNAPLSESDAKDNLNEKLNESLDQESLEDSPSKEITFISLDEKDSGSEPLASETLNIAGEEKDSNAEPLASEASNIIGSAENEGLDVSEMTASNANSDTSFETVNVVKEVLHSGSNEKVDENDDEITQELSEDYQKGYQDALIEFEKTLETEKKAVADFAETLFSVRDDLSELVEEILVEKAQEIGFLLLGERIDTAPELLIERVKKVSAEIIEKTSETIVELNEIDATAFIENLSELPFKVIKKPDLRRGEFRIIAGKSGYQQKISN